MSILRRTPLLIVAALVAALFPVIPASSAGNVQGEEEAPHVEGRALVGAEPGGRAEARRATEANGGKVVQYNADGRFFIVETPSAAPEWVAGMSKNRSVRYAELDYVVHAEDEVVPWAMPKISAPAAWEEQTGSANVVVGVIDTGVDYNHEDLAANKWTKPGTTNVHGRDCRNDDDDPMDDNGHGTHVAGTIGAAANNGKGVVGVNWNVSIMALKFLSSSGSGSTSDAVECLYFAIDNGAHLTSNSWGGGGYSQTLYDAIKASRAANMLFMAAAGNDGDNNDEVSPHYPSNYDLENVVSVAATDSNDELASWSNYGAMTVDLAAPGVGILSTIPGNKYDTYSGTSMATPHVAGAAALVLAEHGTSTSYGAVLDRIYGSVDRLTGLVGKVATGGRLNVARAVERTSTPCARCDTGAPGVPGSLAAGSPTAGSLTLTWTAPDEDDATGGAVSSYRLRYRSGLGPWATVPTGHPQAPGAAEALTVGGLRPGTSYEFELVAKDNVGQTSTATTNALTSAGDVVFFDDMEPAKSGWSADAPWAVTAERPHSETRAWSDSQGANATDPGDPYANRKDLSLYSPSFNLSTATNPKLTLWQHLQLEKSFDFGYIYCNKDGGTWNQLGDRFDGAKSYHSLVLDLSPCAGSSNVKLRFRLVTDRSVTLDGWYIDNVLVRADSTALDVANLSASPNPFSPNNGDDSKDTTTVSFDLNKAASWSASIADSAGTTVCTQTGGAGSSGPQSFVWDGTDGSGCSDGATTVGDGSYTVTVAASTGAESDSGSTTVSVDTQAPAAPANLSATAGNGQVALDWDDNPEADVAGYNVERSTDQTNWTEVAGLITTSAFTDTGLTNGTTYYYRVATEDKAANVSAPSLSPPATPTAPPASWTLTVTNAYKIRGVQHVDLSWTDGPAGAGVDIFRDGVDVGDATNNGSGNGSFTDNIGKKGGGSYTYKVCEKANPLNCSNEVTVTF